MNNEIKEIKIGMYTTDEILEFMTDGEGRGFMGRSMYDAILDYITNLQEKLEYNDLIFKALYKSFSDHEEYENYELLKELKSCYESKDITWLRKFMGENK